MGKYTLEFDVKVYVYIYQRIMSAMIYIIGMPGVGKSHFSELLSQRIGVDWIDLDKQIERIYRNTIPEIIHRKGEEFFRLYEATTLRNQSQVNHQIIISAGGGTPCFFDNMEWMVGSGTVIYLHATPSYLVDSYKAYNLTRPLASGQDISNYLHKTYQNRQPYYMQANHIIEVVRDQDVVIENLLNTISLTNQSN